MELLHPLVVHFAVAFLVLGVGLIGLRSWFRGTRWSFLVPTGRFLLVLGVIAGWAAVLSGQEAYSAIAGTLCDPNVADHHRWYGQVAMWLFTVGALADVGLWWSGPERRWSKISGFLLTGWLIVGTGFLAVAAEHGAHLVYEQAAAVNSPDEQCSRFM